jgi:hypothetical protein
MQMPQGSGSSTRAESTLIGTPFVVQRAHSPPNLEATTSNAPPKAAVASVPPTKELADKPLELVDNVAGCSL